MRRWVAAVAVATACGAALGAPASAAIDNAQARNAPGGPNAATAKPGTFTTKPDTFDVTLVTGDRVHVRLLDDGRQTATVTPARREDGHIPTFQVLEDRGEVSVIPNDVIGLVPHRLDPELFNVTALIDQGGADSASGTVPLIMTYTDQALAAAAPPPAIPGTSLTRRLESIAGAGMSADKKQAAELGGALAALARSEGGQRDRTESQKAAPLAGIDKIWLDRRVRVALDHSVPQISAPAAWAAGFDGTGTTVAVLDTGVDAGHPDLAGKVADARDFTGENDAADRHGHGTHVADTIAGSGAASGGRLKGVAPGAKLLNGKVLGADGSGSMSGIIDGMEWAVAEKRADIVNMSLGSPEPGGPLTDAVDALTRRHGALFVIAAGNRGCDRCVGAPGDAASALTVGAVDRADKLADFSSRGPVPTDFSVKPDLTAPGVGIVAARAKGTLLGDEAGEFYTGVSGTSMATPHVAGAAALLRQARPGIGAGELKALMMGTARHQDGNTVDEQGGGRVDVAAALAGQVVASEGTLGFGNVVKGADRVVRKLTYRNVTTAPVQLALKATGTFTVSPATVALPAGGTAEVTVTLDSAGAPFGPLRGELVASVPQRGGVRTLLTGNIDEPRVELRIRGIARDGRPAHGGFEVLDLERGTLLGSVLPNDATRPCSADPYDVGTCLLVPQGTYSVLGHLFTMPAWEDSTNSKGTPLNVSLAGDPEIRITKNTEIVLDARKAVEVKVQTPDHETKRNMGAAAYLKWYRSAVKGDTPNLGGTYLRPGALIEERLFVQPTRKVTRGTFSVGTQWRLDAPAITMKAPGTELNPDYYAPQWFSDHFTEMPRLDGTELLLAADAGQGRPEDLKGGNLRGKLALIRRSDGIPVAVQSNNAAAAGAKMVAIYNDRPGANPSPGGVVMKLTVPTVWLSREEGEKLLSLARRAPVPVVAKGVVVSPYQYDLFLREKGRVPDDLRYVVNTKSLAKEEADFHTQLAGDVVANEARFAFQPWDTASVTTSLPLPRTPRTRVTYIVPDPEVRWNSGVTTPERPYGNAWPRPQTPRVELNDPQTRTYVRPGQKADVTWFKQPLTPGVDPRHPVRREDDLLFVSMQGFVDASRNFAAAYTSDFERGLRTKFKVYKGEELIAETDYMPAGTVDLPAEKAGYRVEFTVENQASWAKLSTKTGSVWTFTSERTAEGAKTVIPLLLADYDIALDKENRGNPSSIGLTLYHQEGSAGSAVKNVSLEVSYNDGASWKPVRRLTSTGAGSYRAQLDRGSGGNGFVSLRLNASDKQGNTLRQEVIRAYATR
ncbi:S8 family peptidase [Streptosporangium sp. NBC_01469]|uniref:S8 family peptidase n=1 Tax=Streptosporangium sp. NBC_01469 TaxID=2903898 RepID=UPI002E2B89EF|nr:S8 family serine peptidase [Streptosporangium sp. NBC_01469]